MNQLAPAADALFILLGAIMVLAMHAGFAFLELGTVRQRNQVNALVKILVDFSVSTVVYFFVGYTVAYGVGFMTGAETLAAAHGYELVEFFFLLTFAAAIPAIVSGGIAERARFGPQLVATAVLVGVAYPLLEGAVWGGRLGAQEAIRSVTGADFHDFAGSLVVHAFGGWVGLAAVLMLGPRANRYRKDGGISAHPPSSIPFLALGAWVLTVGWFGFNVMSAQTLDKISGLVAVNSLLAMAGGTLAATLLGRNDPGFVHNGPLAGLVAVCAGSVGIRLGQAGLAHVPDPKGIAGIVTDAVDRFSSGAAGLDRAQATHAAALPVRPPSTFAAIVAADPAPAPGLAPGAAARSRTPTSRGATA